MFSQILYKNSFPKTFTGWPWYGFNGKENDNEVYGSTGTFQDYGMRMYDTRVARFISIDPLGTYYPWYTPYQFAGNNPIKYIDLDGAEPTECGADGDVQGAYMTAPSENGDYDDNYHTWKMQNGDWVNKGLAYDPKLTGIEKPTIIPRSGWGAKPANDKASFTQVDPTTFYKYIIIHHTGNTNSPTINDIQDEDLESGKYNDIAYDFAIDLQGNIYQGRPLWKQGASSLVDDKGVLSIAILGDMQNDDLFDWSSDILTPESKTALIQLTNYLSIKYSIEYVGGHQEIHTKYTLCPGNEIMFVMPEIRMTTNTKKPPVLKTGSSWENFKKYLW
jgi:RHS repeat-associated protein